MLCEINIVRSIGVYMHQWFLFPTTPNNKPYVLVADGGITL